MKFKSAILDLLGSKKTLNSFCNSTSQKKLKDAILNQNSINIAQEKPIFKDSESSFFDLQFLNVTTSNKEEIELSDIANLRLKDCSIFRKLGNVISPYISDLPLKNSDVSYQAEFNKEFYIYSGRSIGSFLTDSRVEHEVPIVPLMFTVAGNKKNIKQISDKIGSSFASYENKIFHKMIELSDPKTYLINKDCPIETVYRSLYMCYQDGLRSVQLFLPKGAEGTNTQVLLEEVDKTLPGLSVYCMYVSDLIMRSSNSYSVVIPKEIKISVYQKDPIYVVGLKKENDCYFHSCLSCGYSIEGLTKSYICRYNES